MNQPMRVLGIGFIGSKGVAVEFIQAGNRANPEKAFPVLVGTHDFGSQPLLAGEMLKSNRLPYQELTQEAQRKSGCCYPI